MFDAIKELRPLDGTKWPTGASMRRRLSRLAWKHRASLPAGYCGDDLVNLIRKKGWLQDDGTMYVLKLPPSPSSGE